MNHSSHLKRSGETESPSLPSRTNSTEPLPGVDSTNLDSTNQRLPPNDHASMVDGLASDPETGSST